MKLGTLVKITALKEKPAKRLRFHLDHRMFPIPHILSPEEKVSSIKSTSQLKELQGTDSPWEGEFRKDQSQQGDRNKDINDLKSLAPAVTASI